MSVDTAIEHTGIIDRIDDKSIFVRFTSYSACAACHARSQCSASELEDKIVEIKNSQENFRVGDSVIVILPTTQAYGALLTGYVYPFLLLFLALIVFSVFGIKELYAGLISLSLLIPYYLFIKYFNKNSIKTFQFSLRKPDQS